MRAPARWLFGGALAALLLTTPWPLGSRAPSAALAAATVLILVGGLGHGLLLLRGRALPRTAVDLPALAFLGWTGLQWLTGSTVYPFATATEWLKVLAVYLAFRMALEGARDPRLRRLLAALVLVMLVIVSGYALVQHYVVDGGVTQQSESAYGGTYPWGPFNNRNQFAGYALVGLGLALGATLLRGPATLRLLAGLGLLVGLPSLLGSLSRSGAVAFGVAAVMAPLLALSTLQGRGGRSRLRRLAPLVAAVILVLSLGVAALWGLQQMGGLQQVGERLATLSAPLEEDSALSRIRIWLDTLPMIRDRPATGFGLGTFGWAHMHYRTPIESAFPQHAHDEYLEIVAETGLVGGAICAWLLWGLATGLWRRLAAAEDSPDAGLQLGCVAGWLALLAFAVVDFPTVAFATDLVLAVVAGIGLATPRGLDAVERAPQP